MKGDRKEVEYKQKAGTAWSHSYLNQKPWHPLSYPNQRRKWIAEQSHNQKMERSAEVGREFAQEQDFFRQTAQLSKKEKEKMEAMQAVSFMYMRPPGYNAEAARAAEIADERKKLGLTASTAEANAAVASDGGNGAGAQDKRKPRAKDVFGRTLPTEEEFPALKNAPRHDTGAPARVKPFAIEIRNVKCARCGAFGHQSGDRECPLKDALMPNEEARLIREDPLNVILAQTSDEPLKWELKHQPGLSPARGGFKPDDPNQQIIPDEDIYDEYGGFLPGGADEGALSIPNLLASLSWEQRKELTDANAERKQKRKKHKKGRKRHTHRKKRKYCSSSEDEGKYRHADGGSLDSRKRRKYSSSSEDVGKNQHLEIKSLGSGDGKQRRSRYKSKSSSSEDAQQRYVHRNDDQPDRRDDHRARKGSSKRKLETSDDEDDNEMYERGNDRKADRSVTEDQSNNYRSKRNLQSASYSWDKDKQRDVGKLCRGGDDYITQNSKGKKKSKGSDDEQRRCRHTSDEEPDKGKEEHGAHQARRKLKLEGSEDGYTRNSHSNEGKPDQKDDEYRLTELSR